MQMTSIDKFQVLRAVAFDAKGQPIHERNDRWKLEFIDQTKIRLKCRGFSRNYVLSDDVRYFRVLSRDGETALGPTIGRLLLTGIASNSIKRGSWLGGALMDLSARGVSQRTVYSTMIAFDDTTMLHLILGEKDYQIIAGQVPERATNYVRQKEFEENMRLIDKMIEDGPRVIDELLNSIYEFGIEIVEIKKSVESGASFKDRNAMREKINKHEARMRENARLALAVAHGLNLRSPFYEGGDISDLRLDENGQNNHQDRPQKSLLVSLFLSLSAFFLTFLFLIGITLVINEEIEGFPEYLIGFSILASFVISTFVFVMCWRFFRSPHQNAAVN